MPLRAHRRFPPLMNMSLSKINSGVGGGGLVRWREGEEALDLLFDTKVQLEFL